MTITSRDKLLISGVAAVATLIGYYLFFGRKHRDERTQLSGDLDKAMGKIRNLQEKIMQIEARRASLPAGREIRIWMDGAFDMMHYGHMNAFRQARALGTFLVVGVNSSESITRCKGPPVMNDEERLTTVAGCKFVDAVEPECPYVMNEEYLLHIIDKWNLDYVVHGDDPCIVDGRDVYETAVKMGKYKTIPRTEGVSTTEIVGRMLLMQKKHLNLGGGGEPSLVRRVTEPDIKSVFLRQSNFLTTNRMLRLFSAGNKEPNPGAKIVYIDGGWDMFHAGHIEILEMAKQHGDYVIVGVHNDALVNKQYGSNYPILNMQERVLSVLGCRYVDDVLLDAPWTVTREMVASLKISVVLNGTQGDSHVLARTDDVQERYRVPIELGMFEQLQSPSNLSVVEIVSRIHANEERFRNKFEKKAKAEQEYYDIRYKDVPKVDGSGSDDN